MDRELRARIRAAQKMPRLTDQRVGEIMRQLWHRLRMVDRLKRLGEQPGIPGGVD